jgi:hypothetical protein
MTVVPATGQGKSLEEASLHPALIQLQQPCFGRWRQLWWMRTQSKVLAGLQQVPDLAGTDEAAGEKRKRMPSR